MYERMSFCVPRIVPSCQLKQQPEIQPKMAHPAVDPDIVSENECLVGTAFSPAFGNTSITPCTEFTCFPALPTECRLLIWKVSDIRSRHKTTRLIISQHAAHFRRSIYLEASGNFSGIPLHDVLTTRDVEIRYESYRLPMALQVNNESRNEGTICLLPLHRFQRSIQRLSCPCMVTAETCSSSGPPS